MHTWQCNQEVVLLLALHRLNCSLRLYQQRRLPGRQAAMSSRPCLGFNNCNVEKKKFRVLYGIHQVDGIPRGEEVAFATGKKLTGYI